MAQNNSIVECAIGFLDIRPLFNANPLVRSGLKKVYFLLIISFVGIKSQHHRCVVVFRPGIATDNLAA